jgi:two-component system sensor histidine kinase RegB
VSTPATDPPVADYPAVSVAPDPATYRLGEDAASRIVLSWLVRLRWLAASGQVAAIALAWVVLDIHYPLMAVGVVIGVNLASNAVLTGWLRARPDGMSWRPLLPAVLVLDILLLTALLHFTGGSDNPFVILFAIHVAMAAVVLGPAWAWATVGLVAICYAMLTTWHWPFDRGRIEPLPSSVVTSGRSAALALVVVLLAYFIGQVVGALRRRRVELAELREKAQANERLAAITGLAAGAAHELGTPLGTIALVAKEMELAARSRRETELAEDAALVRQQVERCRGILEHLRGDVAGRGTDEPGTTDLPSTIGQALDALAPDRRAHVTLELEPQLPRVEGAPRALTQAVGLLLNNAFDASSDEGRVRLVAERVDDEIRVAVVDQGTGMDADTLRRAADPFFTTKDPGRGMGLGLFLVRMIAERAGGGFSLDSTPGVGTTATLRLIPADRHQQAVG